MELRSGRCSGWARSSGMLGRPGNGGQRRPGRGADRPHYAFTHEIGQRVKCLVDVGGRVEAVPLVLIFRCRRGGSPYSNRSSNAAYFPGVCDCSLMCGHAGYAGTTGHLRTPTNGPAEHGGDMDLGLAERTALVCASTSGLGLATARALCEDGARVVVTSRSSERAEEGSSERAEEVAAALPNAIGIGCDLLAADGAARLFGESTKRVGKIDILVLNGPGPAPGTAADVDDAGVDSAVAASVKPQVQLVRWDPLRGQSSCPCGGQCRRSESITLDSIRTHCGRHFPVQRVAKATYWDILKRRAGDNRIDFIEGVAAALTPIAFFETVMVRKL